MDNIRRFETINDYNIFNNNETLHPLVSVVDLSKASPRQGSKMYFGFYTIFLKDVKCGDLIYGRQFITRDNAHKGVLERFEKLLNEYFETDKPQLSGLPSVASCATALNLSAGYFGDLIKKETGKTAQEYIQMKIIDIAKEKIFDHTKSVSEIAYELGFKYPQHFTRLFKQKVGYSPREYRTLN